ncbi:MAG: UbiA prenyltransferase family protein [Anaerolineae bacterium]|nr:UbiA prenyltransferase family protein [Anaerolineae bacterium]
MQPRYQVLNALVRTTRPKQWIKNGFIFVPLVFDGQMFPLSGDPFLRTVAGFILLCMTGSTIYLVNDIVDIERDKLHPTKCKRPLPAGELSVRVAAVAAVVLPLIALALGYLLEPAFALVLATYLALHLTYSFRIKNMVILDVMAVAVGFVLRVVAGVALIEVQRFSPVDVPLHHPPGAFPRGGQATAGTHHARDGRQVPPDHVPRVQPGAA